MTPLLLIMANDGAHHIKHEITEVVSRRRGRAWELSSRREECMVPGFSHVFEELRGIMLSYARRLDCKIDRDDELYVDTKHILENKRPLDLEVCKPRSSTSVTSSCRYM